MAIRKLPDGSVLDTDTGALIPGDSQREAVARRISERTGGYKPPVRNKGDQVMVVDNVEGKHLIEPVHHLAISPYSAMGTAPQMSDSMKRILLVGGIVAAAFGVTWLNSKMQSKAKKK